MLNRRPAFLSLMLGMACVVVSGCADATSRAGGMASSTARAVTSILPNRAHQDGPVMVEVVRDGDRWTADFTLNADAPVWAFQVSALRARLRTPWRASQWRVETPGVKLDRIGAYDVLRSSDGGPAPRQIRISLTPAAGDLEAEYAPALMFSDGAVALYSNQFDLIPLPSIAAAQSLPADLNGVTIPGGPSAVTWRDAAGPVLIHGQRQAEAAATNARTYVLFGKADVTDGEAVATVMDPALPSWLGQELRAFTPRVLDYYSRRMGPTTGDRPMVMVSWSGPSRGRSSMSGSVLPGLIVMDFDGEGVLDRSPEVLARARWFIGHEAAHFWLGSNGLRYQFARDAWITEGGADLMAVRALKASDPTYDDRAELQREVDDCVSLATRRPVASAGERGENRAYYACGAVWAMAFEAARKARDGGDFFDVVADFQRSNRRDGVLTREAWLEGLTRTSRDPSLRLSIEQMLDQGVADPAAVIARLFDRTGVGYRFQSGRVILS